MYGKNEGTPDGVPFRFLAAAVIIVVAAVPVVAAGIPAAVAVAAAEEQQNQNDDPPAVVAAPVVTTHNQYLRLKFSSDPSLIPCYSGSPFLCGRDPGKIDRPPSRGYNDKNAFRR